MRITWCTYKSLAQSVNRKPRRTVADPEINRTPKKSFNKCNKPKPLKGWHLPSHPPTLPDPLQSSHTHHYIVSTLLTHQTFLIYLF